MSACHVKLLVCSAAAAVLVASAMRESLALDIYQPDGAVLNPSDPTRQFVRPLDQDSLPTSKFSSSLTSGALNVNMDSNFRDTTRIDGSSFLGFIVGNNAKWQDNQVGYTNLNTDLGDTIRFKTRFGASTYDASDQFFASLGKSQDDQRMTRFAGVGFAPGLAAQTRAEEDVFRFGDGRVTVFQEFTRV